MTGRPSSTTIRCSTLLKKPNPHQGGADFLEALYGHLLVAGNAYVEAVTIDGAVRELYALRPDRMSVVPDAIGWPAAFEYAANGRTCASRRTATGGSRRSCTCANSIRSTTITAFRRSRRRRSSLDVHNAASAWNKALLDNAARPSGALVYKGENGANLSEEQFERLRDELAANFSGAANAGRPLLLEGGLTWQSMSLSPKDMDFMQLKHGAAREIALAFGVPPMLFGIPGDNTYANYREANLAFWRQTVLPLVGALRECARRLARAGVGGGAATRLRRRPGGGADAGARGAVAAGERGGFPDAGGEAGGGGVWERKARIKQRGRRERRPMWMHHSR